MREVTFKPPYKVEGTKIVDSEGEVIQICFTKYQADYNLAKIKYGMGREALIKKYKI